MRYIWKGPATVVEVWPVETADAPLFSGPVKPDVIIEADLPADHPQILGWLAFELVEAQPEGSIVVQADAPAPQASADDATSSRRKLKEISNV